MKFLVKNIYFILILLGISVLYSGCNKEADIKIYSYPVPVPSSFTPMSGYPGIDVTISGKDFGTYSKAVSVFFGGIKADTIRSCADNQIVVRVPDKALSGKITLKIWTHTIDSIGSFTVIPPPVVTSISSDAGAPGDIIKVRGTGFGSNVANVVLNFNGTPGTISAVTNDTLIIATVPANFTSGKLVLSIGGYPISAGTFTYLTFVETPIYQLDFENNLDATIGENATYIQGGGQPLTYVNGISGKAVWMAGYDAASAGDIGQAISLPQNVAQYNELTISCWTQYDPSDAHANWGTKVCSFGKDGNNQITLSCSQGWPDMNNNIMSRIVYNGAATAVKTSQTIAGTTWHHLCWTLSKTNLKGIIYLDGVQIATMDLPSSYDLTLYAQSICYIGQCVSVNNGEPAYKGGIDKFQIFNSALSANQIYTLYYKK